MYCKTLATIGWQKQAIFGGKAEVFECGPVLSPELLAQLLKFAHDQAEILPHDLNRPHRTTLFSTLNETFFTRESLEQWVSKSPLIAEVLCRFFECIDGYPLLKAGASPVLGYNFFMVTYQGKGDEAANPNSVHQDVLSSGQPIDQTFIFRVDDPALMCGGGLIIKTEKGPGGDQIVVPYRQNWILGFENPCVFHVGEPYTAATDVHRVLVMLMRTVMRSGDPLSVILPPKNMRE